MQEALGVLQSLDPVGLGSRSVQECLLLQLKAQGHEATLAATIIQDHFDLLLRRKLSELSRLAHVPMESIREALNLIATLDPAPGRSFSSDTNHIITPDVRIFKSDGEWVVQLNETHLPRLCLSPDRPGVDDLLDDIVAGVRSACTYAGAATIAEFAERAVVGVQSAAGYSEGLPQGTSW